MSNALKTTILCAALAMGGCSSTPMSEAFADHFSSAKQDREHGKCMSDNAMFNNRQLMVTPSAVESAWSYCVKQSEIRYPGKGEARTTAIGWEVH
jgi:hypothetical protein